MVLVPTTIRRRPRDRFRPPDGDMAEVLIYTTPFCGYCIRAKRLLDSKGVSYTEIDIWQEPARREEMIHRDDLALVEETQ